jgi:hypothetical protein
MDDSYYSCKKCGELMINKTSEPCHLHAPDDLTVLCRFIGKGIWQTLAFPVSFLVKVLHLREQG